MKTKSTISVCIAGVGMLAAMAYASQNVQPSPAERGVTPPVSPAAIAGSESQGSPGIMQNPAPTCSPTPTPTPPAE